MIFLCIWYGFWLILGLVYLYLMWIAARIEQAIINRLEGR